MTSHWHSNRSQVYWTCRALALGRTINHMDEIGEVQGWRLGAIVHNLRTKYHWPILTEYRGPERIAHYSLPKGCNMLALALPRSALSLKDELKEALGGHGNGAEAASSGAGPAHG